MQAMRKASAVALTGAVAALTAVVGCGGSAVSPELEQARETFMRQCVKSGEAAADPTAQATCEAAWATLEEDFTEEELIELADSIDQFVGLEADVEELGDSRDEPIE